jgi:hypothetical protein
MAIKKIEKKWRLLVVLCKFKKMEKMEMADLFLET